MTALRTEMGSELRGLNDQQQRKIHRRKYYHETMSSLRTITSIIWQIIYQILGHFTSAKTVWRGTEQTSWTALQWRQWDPRLMAGNQEEQRLNQRREWWPDTKPALRCHKTFPVPSSVVGRRRGREIPSEKGYLLSYDPKRLLKEKSLRCFNLKNWIVSDNQWMCASEQVVIHYWKIHALDFVHLSCSLLTLIWLQIK